VDPTPRRHAHWPPLVVRPLELSVGVVPLVRDARRCRANRSDYQSGRGRRHTGLACAAAGRRGVVPIAGAEGLRLLYEASQHSNGRSGRGPPSTHAAHAPQKTAPRGRSVCKSVERRSGSCRQPSTVTRRNRSAAPSPVVLARLSFSTPVSTTTSRSPGRRLGVMGRVGTGLSASLMVHGGRLPDRLLAACPARARRSATPEAQTVDLRRLGSYVRPAAAVRRSRDSAISARLRWARSTISCASRTVR